MSWQRYLPWNWGQDEPEPPRKLKKRPRGPAGPTPKHKMPKGRVQPGPDGAGPQARPVAEQVPKPAPASPPQSKPPATPHRSSSARESGPGPRRGEAARNVRPGEPRSTADAGGPMPQPSNPPRSVPAPAAARRRTPRPSPPKIERSTKRSDLPRGPQSRAPTPSVRPPRKAQPVPNRRAQPAPAVQRAFDMTIGDHDMATPEPAPEATAPVKLEVDDLDGALLAVHTAGSVEALGKGVIDLLQAHQPAACMAMLIRKDGFYIRQAAVGAPPEAQGVKIDAQDALGRRIEKGTRVHSVDVRGKAIRTMGGSYLYPCKGRKGIVGAIVTSAHDRERAHHEWVGRLAPHVGIALDNLASGGGNGGGSAALAEAERLQQATRKLVQATPLALLLQRIVREAVRVTKAEKASLMLYDMDRGDLVLRAARGLYDAMMEQRIHLGEVPAMRVPSDRGAIGKVFRSGESVWATGATGTATPEGLNGPSLIVSLAAMGRALGVLQLTSTKPNPRFSSRARYMEQYCRAAGLAIWSAQVYERVAQDPVGKLHLLPVAEAWIEAAMLTARRQDKKFAVMLARMGGGEGAGPSPKRVERFGEVLKKVAPAGFDLGGHDGRGLFLVGLPDYDAEAAQKVAKRITSEMGTMYYGESTWCFVVAERAKGESCFALLGRARIALDQAWQKGPGVRHLVAKGR